MKKIAIIGLKFIDNFGQPVQITFNREKKFTTVLGGLLSLAIYGVTLSLVLSVGTNLLNRAFPKTTMTNSHLIDSPIVNLTELGMVYSTVILTRDFQPVNDLSIFTIELSQFVVKKEEDGSKSFNYNTLPRVDCSLYYDHFKNKGFEQEFNGNNLEQGVCFNINRTDLLIGGNFQADYFSNILFRVNKCNNSTTSSVICQPESVINDKLQGGYFEFYYIDSNIDINSYREPYKQYFANYFILLDPLATKFVDIFFKSVNIQSDAGFIFEEPVNNKSLIFDYYREQIDTSTGGDKVIDFYINSSNNFLTYTRIYMKFQDFAATIGGLLKVMMVGGSFINIIFNNSKMYEKMFNALFSFKEAEKDTPKAKKTSDGAGITYNEFSKSQHVLNDMNNSCLKSSNTKNKQTDEMNSNTKTIADPLSNNFFKNDMKKENTIKVGKFDKKTMDAQISRSFARFTRTVNMKQANFDLSPKSLIKMYSCFCCIYQQRKKKKLFDFAFDKLFRYLDYLEIIKTLQEFHRMKKVIFSKTQESLFDFHKKPEISIEKMKKKSTGSVLRSEEEQEYFNLYKSYLKAKSKNNDKTYKRLLINLDDDLKSVFESLGN